MGKHNSRINLRPDSDPKSRAGLTTLAAHFLIRVGEFHLFVVARSV